jgi:hypothetical protein
LSRFASVYWLMTKLMCHSFWLSKTIVGEWSFKADYTTRAYCFPTVLREFRNR